VRRRCGRCAGSIVDQLGKIRSYTVDGQQLVEGEPIMLPAARTSFRGVPPVGPAD